MYESIGRITSGDPFAKTNRPANPDLHAEVSSLLEDSGAILLPPPTRIVASTMVEERLSSEENGKRFNMRKRGWQ